MRSSHEVVDDKGVWDKPIHVVSRYALSRFQYQGSVAAVGPVIVDAHEMAVSQSGVLLFLVDGNLVEAIAPDQWRYAMKVAI